MELKINPHHQNQNPIKGILIKGDDLSHCLNEIHCMNLDLNYCYAIPDVTANSVWGFFALCDGTNDNIALNSYCQLVHNLLFIPENTILIPSITPSELATLLGNKLAILHPEFGFFYLEEKIYWSTLFTAPLHKKIDIFKPIEKKYQPQVIKSLELIALKPEQVLEKLEQDLIPERQNIDDNKLTWIEKVKLKIYRLLFDPDKERNSNRPITKLITRLEKNFTSSKNRFADYIHDDFEDLEQRNKKAIEKLLDRLKKDPLDALKYAIPLDELGVKRGQHRPSSFGNSILWSSLSLNQSSVRYSAGGSINLDTESYNKIHHQYITIAQKLIHQKEFLKAAFIYLKLLGSPLEAAKILENAKFYHDAAAIYDKYNHFLKAAECYEKGSMYKEAIEMYKKIQNNMKVADLSMKINNYDEAKIYYMKVIENYIATNQFVQASLVYKTKLYNLVDAKEILLTGWRQKKDAFNCLNNYFRCFDNEKELLNSIHQIYYHEVNNLNDQMYLKALKFEYQIATSIRNEIRELAYEIIAHKSTINKKFIHELNAFSNNDNHLPKDTLAFQIK